MLSSIFDRHIPQPWPGGPVTPHNVSMALNVALNHRLESSTELLENIVRAVQFQLDLSISRHSVYHFFSGLSLIHNRVKAVVKHGAKVKHYLIFKQPSFASFDSWLEKSLLEHSFHHTLSRPGIQRRIHHSYYEWAFLRNNTLIQLLIDCLCSLATRDFDLITTIPSYTTGQYSLPRSYSMPVSGLRVLPLPLSIEGGSFTKIKMSSVPIVITSPELAQEPEVSTSSKLEQILDQTVIDDDDTVVPLSIAETLGIPKFSYSYGSPVLSVPDFSGIEDRPRLDPMIASFKPKVDQEQILEPLKSPLVKSFLESDGFLQPDTFGNFPLPQKGQSLKDFLSSLSDASQPDLDRENSHFNISEALISAFESMKVKQKLEALQEQRHLERMEAMFGNDAHRVGRRWGETTLRIRKKFPLRQRASEAACTETEESEFEFWSQRRHPPVDIKKKPRISTFGSDGRSESLMSTTEVTTSGSQSLSSSSEDLNTSSFSAENVALNLLRNVRLEEGQLLEASTLQWLVTERDCPQALLPLPKNWTSASESETDSFDKSIRLRGTVEWAPPRPQIIFTIHPPPNLQVLTDVQKYRCAGCGVKVQAKYASTYRFCYYLGRYFCSGCHSKKTARLPQMILHRWDFSFYQVSNFSSTLLESLRFDPVYNLMGINPGLARKGRVGTFRTYRLQIKSMGEYLQNCKGAVELYDDLHALPSYYIADPDLYSIEDLINLRFGSGSPLKVKEIVQRGIQHILQCSLCRQLGFHCEICRSPEIIFPFQLIRVHRCSTCSACYHQRCFSPGLNACPKCLRVNVRKESLASDEYCSELGV